MATYSRREVHTTRVEFIVPAPYPDGACWVEVYKAVAAATNEMRERGLIADVDEPADNELFVSPGDSEVIVAFVLRSEGDPS